VSHRAAKRENCQCDQPTTAKPSGPKVFSRKNQLTRPNNQGQNTRSNCRTWRNPSKNLWRQNNSAFKRRVARYPTKEGLRLRRHALENYVCYNYQFWRRTAASKNQPNPSFLSIFSSLLGHAYPNCPYRFVSPRRPLHRPSSAPCCKAQCSVSNLSFHQPG
jgi:hypothetical protein